MNDILAEVREQVETLAPTQFNPSIYHRESRAELVAKAARIIQAIQHKDERAQQRAAYHAERRAAA